MYGLFLSLFLLGLSAIDPVGIAAMPVLLAQKNPLVRSTLFLFGSFSMLIIMGLVFAQGLGSVVLRFETVYPWILPAIEIFAGVVLVFVASVMVRHLKRFNDRSVLSKAMKKWLQLKNWQLFLFGAVVVGIQSLLDVVFIVAMIHVQQFDLTFGLLLLSVVTYAVAALCIQFLIVLIYKFVTAKRRAATLIKINYLTTRYGTKSVIAISFLFAGALLVSGFMTFIGQPLF